VQYKIKRFFRFPPKAKESGLNKESGKGNKHRQRPATRRRSCHARSATDASGERSGIDTALEKPYTFVPGFPFLPFGSP
jgi:hypothetical protein